MRALYRSCVHAAFYENSARADILYPTFKGEEGHPPLIGRSLVDKILRWRGTDGLHGFFKDHPDQLYNEVIDDMPIIDEDIQQAIREGKYKGFSILGAPIKSIQEMDRE